MNAHDLGVHCVCELLGELTFDGQLLIHPVRSGQHRNAFTGSLCAH